MFLIDDIALRSCGIVLPGLDLIWVIEQIRDYSYRKLYNVEKITEKLKEVRLLYEFGELSKEEYAEQSKVLKERLRVAKKARQQFEAGKSDQVEML